MHVVTSEAFNRYPIRTLPAYMPNQRHLRRAKSKDERCLQVEQRALSALSLKVLKDQGRIMYSVCVKR